MLALYAEHRSEVDFAEFLHGLSERDHVLTFTESRTAELIGFSTILRRKYGHIRAGYCLYSGDTVVRPDHRGAPFLRRAFYRYLLMTKMLSPLEPVYWLQGSTGYKSYIMMTRAFRESYPRRDRATPARFASAMSRFFTMKFGADYAPREGLIRVRSPKGVAIGRDTETPSHPIITNPEVAFFLERNPGYNQGDKLACIAEIRFADLFRKVAGQGLAIS